MTSINNNNTVGYVHACVNAFDGSQIAGQSDGIRASAFEQRVIVSTEKTSGKDDAKHGLTYLLAGS